ncbi:MAG: winged helix-turn-helix transcriptional regulator [Anaerolineaceae bacterium]|nr:winged helix-turn-helix transcriptional regulator [Anaerolineaceae bacterium]MBN2676640.1 winged helix-turn-helix transcriptional regulator [Anaerolineaceae bacterium]
MNKHYMLEVGENKMAMDVRNIREEVVQLHAHICSGLADPNRILIIYNLVDGPKNVNDLAAALELSQPTVSRHLKVLRDRGIVHATRDGQSVYYTLTDRRIIKALDLLRLVMVESLQKQALLFSQTIEKKPL